MLNFKFQISNFKFFCLLLTAYCLLPTDVWASQNYLQDLRVYKNSDELRVIIDFLNPIKAEVVPSFYEKSIQIDISDAYIHPSKRLFEIGDKLLEHIYALQHSKDNVRMRLVVAPSGLSLKDRLSVKRDDKNLIIIIKKLPVASVPVQIKQTGYQSPVTSLPVQTGQTGQKPEIKSLVEKLPLVTANIAHAEDIKPVVSKEEGTTSEPQTPKSDYLKYEEPLPMEPPDISFAVVKTIAALAIILAVVLLVSYIAKKVLKKNNIVFGKDKLIRVLGTSYIGVKKAITLLDVAGEVLVIGVTNNNITMLTRLENEDAKSKLLNNSHHDPSTGWVPRVTSHQQPNNKEEMVAQITKAIQEKVRKLKRIP